MLGFMVPMFKSVPQQAQHVPMTGLFANRAAEGIASASRATSPLRPRTWFRPDNSVWEPALWFGENLDPGMTQPAPTDHAMEVAHQDPMCHTPVAMAQIAAKNIRLGAQGRLVLPASLRRALSLSAGDALVARADGLDRIVLEKPSAARAGLQERFAKTRGKLDLAGSLIADRRSEARRDAR